VVLRLEAPDGEALGLVVLTPADALPHATAQAAGASAGLEVARALREEQLRRLASYDVATGLPHGALFEQQVAAALRQRAEGEEVGVVLLTVDQLDAVARSFGRSARNELLRRVADRLLLVRHQSVLCVARTGGPFALLLLGPQGTTAAVVPGLLVELERPWPLGRREVRSTARAGSAVATDPATSAAHLCEQAEAALGEAVRRSQSGWFAWSAELTAASHEVLLLETMLQAALGQGELQVRYQPQVDLVSRRITGAEALVRWQRPGGMVSPARFLPTAETTGLIVDIDKWVLHEACHQARRWLDDGLPPLRMAVNVSSRTLAAPGFAASVVAALDASGLPADLLEVEVTESLELLEATAAVEELARLRVMGVHVAIDDFGTGYSNVGRLRQLPVDRIKIDQSFVREIEGDGGAICSAVIALARTLDLDVIAEGVETEEQCALLDARGCTQFQGYLVSPPVEAAAFAGLLA
jgi:predicted signal transduction protein with EAL and GGDEF domain